MAALEHAAPRPQSLGAVLCVLAAASGGWVEIVETHDRPSESRELVGYFELHGRDRSLHAPIAWPHATQLDFVRFLAGVARMTFRFPQHAAFDDPVGGVTVDATAIHAPGRRDAPVSFAICASSALTGNTLETELTLRQTALTAIVRSCCASFPGLGVADWHAAWS